MRYLQRGQEQGQGWQVSLMSQHKGMANKPECTVTDGEDALLQGMHGAQFEPNRALNCER